MVEKLAFICLFIIYAFFGFGAVWLAYIEGSPQDKVFVALVFVAIPIVCFYLIGRVVFGI